MRQPMRSLAVLTILGLAGLAACGDDGGDGAVTTTTAAVTTSTDATTSTTGDGTTSTTGDGLALSERCTHEEADVTIEISYPEGWETNDGETVPPCTAFDPDPFEIEPATEFPPGLAAVVRVERVGYERATNSETDEVESRRELEVDGRRAVRLEVVASGEGLEPQGQRSLRYVVDAGTDRTIIVTTRDVDGNDYEQSTEVLDAMVSAFAIEPAGG